MFPNGPEAAYTAQALFYSSRPYGFLLDQPDFARWRMDSDQPNAWQTDAYTSTLDYAVAPGPAPQAIKSITGISGRERVPPTWAIAPEIDRATVAGTPQTQTEAASEIGSWVATSIYAACGQAPWSLSSAVSRCVSEACARAVWMNASPLGRSDPAAQARETTAGSASRTVT
jgi:hypothetical protein